MNAIKSEQKGQRFVSGAFDGQVAFTGTGTITQYIDIPIDPQYIFDGIIPFDSLVLKPQAAAFDTPIAVLGFVNSSETKFVILVFTNTGIDVNLRSVSLPAYGPGMWVFVADTSDDPFQIEQAIRVTDGTNILIPEVHLATLTGVFEDMIVDGASTIDAHSAIWSDCLPFARFPYSTILTLPQTSYEVLLPQLTKAFPIGTPIAITK